MKIHILGICGTFMAGVAVLAQESGHKVTGSDYNIYPPMSTQLENLGIGVMEGFDAAHLSPKPDCVLVGNVMQRGNPAVEYMLSEGLRYCSGPQWLREQVLQDRWVLSVSGTHGKTTTTTMLAWILEAAGKNPGFLIGGVPHDFAVSARLGSAPFFVIEADEYDTAFFDKRSKFIHYGSRTLVINNLEFDHADIFPDLAAIQRQFHHLVRTVPSNGCIFYPEANVAIQDVLDKGCWTATACLHGPNSLWRAGDVASDGSSFMVYYKEQLQGRVEWLLLGSHNVNNAIAAIAAAHHASVPIPQAIEALSGFHGVKRRLEKLGVFHRITLYDDFAHHPTAIAEVIAGLRAHLDAETRLIVLAQCGSYSMRMGAHEAVLLAQAFCKASAVFLLVSDPQAAYWRKVSAHSTVPTQYHGDVDAAITAIQQELRSGDHVLMMSNTGVGQLRDRLIEALKKIPVNIL